MTVAHLEDFTALEPFFRIIEQGLDGAVDGGHFFELFAEDAVTEFVVTVPGYPRRVEGRDNLAELYRGYGNTFVLERWLAGQASQRAGGKPALAHRKVYWTAPRASATATRSAPAAPRSTP